MNSCQAALNYATPVILVGGGDVPDDKLLDVLNDNWPVIAADGGADTLRRLGITPKAIIGDMDSLREIDQWRDGTRIIAISEQETTDFEKCVYSVSARLLVAFGFTGDRFDHTLAALHVMHKFAREVNIVLSAGGDICVGCCGDLSLKLRVGLRFSIYPLTEVRFADSSGLEYPLTDLTLAQGSRIGTSNCVSNEEVKLQLVDGIYVVILPITELNTIIRQMI